MRGASTTGALRATPWAVCLAAVLALGAQPAPPPLLDVATWRAVPADGVEMHLAAATGPDGVPALRIDYDFHGRGGWAAARRALPLTLPEHYELRFQLRGEGPPNNLEVKLVDPSGDNVWWHVARAMAWPQKWTPFRVKQRQITFAWGPQGGGELHTLGALELTVSASSGGHGTVWVNGLEIVPVEPLVAPAGSPRAVASSATPDHAAATVLDGSEQTWWQPAGDTPAELTVDFGGVRELGGLTLVWARGGAPRHFFVELSSDGREWGGGREVTRRVLTDAANDAPLRTQLRLPDAEARLARVRLPADAGCHPCALAELLVRPLEFGATANDTATTIAREAPRGAYPRGLTEAVYWTVVGAPGDPEEALVSEDGIVEPRQKSFSLEPMVFLDGKLFTWADVTAEQSLLDGDLPIPTVTWRIPLSSPANGPGLARLEVTALAARAGSESELMVRYRLVNDTGSRVRGKMFVLARPFQVNPPHQSLNVAGGVAPLRRLECAGALGVEGVVRVWALPVVGCGLVAADDGALVDVLGDGEDPHQPELEDSVAGASAVLSLQVDLAPGAEEDVVLGLPPRDPFDESWNPVDRHGVDAFPALVATERQRWREALDRVTIDVPYEALPLVRTLRSNLAFVEIHRDGAALQPGSRAYARSWIRDGALTGVALLRLRHGDTAARFAEWFAGYQYPDGKVPCCVDQRGADPVAENDSHGELIHLIAETFRYTHDRAFAERLFPHVEAAVNAIEALRQQQRTPAYRSPDKLAFFGLLPASISHEGYSAKPVHSYWDDTFAFRGLDDAVGLAQALGRGKLAESWSRRRDELRADLQVSLLRVMEQQQIDYLPGSAELADFDSTATTTMLDPGGLLPYLPRYVVEGTFERFWRDFVARRDGGKAWEAYTPYEIRHVGSFVRLAATAGATGQGAAARAAAVDWKGRAHELLAWYKRDQRPPGWNGWPEVVYHAYREPRFLGDLPHGWVGSDFIRSLLDLFAFESEEHALVLGAGIPTTWLARPGGVAIRNLATPWGPLGYSLQPVRGGYRFIVSAGLELPPGGIVLVPPTRAAGQSVRLDGRPIPLAADGTLVLRRLPAVVDFLDGAIHER